MIDGTSGRPFSLVEHHSRTRSPPLHRHTREDEYSYVLEGRMDLLRDVLVAGPRSDLQASQQWDTFECGGDGAILEIISPEVRGVLR